MVVGDPDKTCNGRYHTSNRRNRCEYGDPPTLAPMATSRVVLIYQGDPAQASLQLLRLMLSVPWALALHPYRLAAVCNDRRIDRVSVDLL